MKLRFGFVLLSFLLVTFSCSMRVDQEFTVINQSTFDVSMRDIQNATITALDIAAGETDTITFKIGLIEDTSIGFSFTPASLVSSVIDKDNKEIRFSNR